MYCIDRAAVPESHDAPKVLYITTLQSHFIVGWSILLAFQTVTLSVLGFSNDNVYSALGTYDYNACKQLPDTPVNGLTYQTVVH